MANGEIQAYLWQVARSYRFLERFEKSMTFDFMKDANKLNDLEDNLWAFFQNCWHIRDWISNDPSVQADEKRAVLHDVSQSGILLAVGHLANASKHFVDKPTGEAPTQTEKNANGTWTFTHYVILPDGTYLPALEAARRAMGEWQEILKRHGMSCFVDAVGA
jgi:hypothetical protein